LVVETASFITKTAEVPFYQERHGIKGFVIPTKSFVTRRIAKIFCYNNKMFSSINKTFGCCSKIFGCSNKKIFVVANYVAVIKPFFPVGYCP